MTAEPLWVSIEKAAAMFGCSSSFIKRAIADGQIQRALLGRRAVVEVEAMRQLVEACVHLTYRKAS